MQVNMNNNVLHKERRITCKKGTHLTDIFYANQIHLYDTPQVCCTWKRNTIRVFMHHTEQAIQSKEWPTKLFRFWTNAVIKGAGWLLRCQAGRQVRLIGVGGCPSSSLRWARWATWPGSLSPACNVITCTRGVPLYCTWRSALQLWGANGLSECL